MAKQWAKAFYNSQQWKAARREALRRDHYTCRECLSARAEEVHHVIELTPENINDPMIALYLDNLFATTITKITKGNTGDLPEGYIFDEMGQVVRR